ncbi:hypothetical protein BGZ81_000816 [Podila clonocystis]|nr:hypothetical protein BGZ81_000816 [Podila clonocystis]
MGPEARGNPDELPVLFLASLITHNRPPVPTDRFPTLTAGRSKGEVEVDEQESKVNKGGGDPALNLCLTEMTSDRDRNGRQDETEAVGRDGDENKDEDEDENEQDVDMDGDDWEYEEEEHESGSDDGGKGNEAPALSDIGSNKTQSDVVEEASQEVHDAFSTYEEFDVRDIYRFLEKKRDPLGDIFTAMDKTEFAESCQGAVTEAFLELFFHSSANSVTSLSLYDKDTTKFGLKHAA